MDIQIISTIENAKQYLHSAKSSQIDLNELLQIHMIDVPAKTVFEGSRFNFTSYDNGGNND